MLVDSVVYLSQLSAYVRLSLARNDRNDMWLVPWTHPETDESTRLIGNLEEPGKLSSDWRWRSLSDESRNDRGQGSSRETSDTSSSIYPKTT